MASFVKLFKRKTPKQSSLSDYFNSTEVHTTSKINAMQDGKQFRASSLRINKKPHAHKKETNGGYEECTKNVIENSHYRSPYSVFTEPKKDRSTRSCPVGPPDNKETDRIQKFHKFTPPFYVQATIHEKSGSYENLTTSQLKQRFWAEKHSEREKEGKAREGESEGKKERACGKRKEEKPKKHKEDMDGLVTYGTRDNLAKRRHGRHFTAHCSHHNPSQQPLSTSEYWSADPSPMAEDQPHRHLRISQRSTCEFREEMMMALVGLEAGKEEEGSSEDGDSSSDDQEISPTALLQFWQQQVRMLKCELKSSRETAEKYRSKYLRLKTKTDELSSELTREKERNIWLFNQLIATNDQITQLNWAQLHFRDSQRQHNFLSMNSAESVGNNSPLLEKCEINAHHRSTAGEVQAELSSDDFEYKSTAFRKGICNVETDRENAQQTMDQQQKQSIRTPTPIPMGSANNVTNGLLMNNSFCAPGTPFLNFNLFHNAQQVHNQLQVEVARGNHSNGFRNSNSRLISPTIKKGITKAINDNSPMTMEEDENGEQMSREEEGDNESLSGTDPEEHCPIVIPLDLFCQQQIEQKSSSKELMEGSKETLERRATMSAKYLLRHSRSSEDLRFSEKGAMIGCSTMGSSSEDDIRMWKKQLRSRGDRVLFRPSRKSLFSGIIVKDEKGPNKIFRRFGQPEREALAKFDYLRDERSDLSGLMSSPEKIAEIN